jgi:hypothetical protein
MTDMLLDKKRNATGVEELNSSKRNEKSDSYDYNLRVL